MTFSEQLKSNFKNTEFQQAVVRIGFFVVSAAYIGLGDFSISSEAFRVYSFVFVAYISLNFWHVIKYPRVKNRSLVTLFFDIVAISFSLFYTGGIYSPLYVLYIWVFVSQASRFGRRNLYAASFMSVISFVSVLLYDASWQGRLFEVGFLIMSLLALPVYMDAMLKKLHLAIIDAHKASEAKSIFLANMSHELRTPLNAIIGYSEILKDDASVAGNEGLFDDLSKISSSGEHLLKLISSVLDLSRIEAGKVEMEFSSIKVKELLRDVEVTIQLLVKKNNTDFKINYINDPGEIITDALKLKQVLLNILGNAAKFTKNGNIELIVEKSGGLSVSKISMKIVDTGIGISAEQAERLFASFTQADSSTTRKYGGTGLGLIISRSYCRLMGGDLILKEQQGVGSCFEVTLPINSELAVNHDCHIECVK